MARTKRSRRSYGAGEWGRNRVRVFPDPKTGLYQIEWRDNGRRLTRSLKHRDWALAKRQADEVAAGFAVHEPVGKAEAEPEPLTPERLFSVKLGAWGDTGLWGLVTPASASERQRCPSRNGAGCLIFLSWLTRWRFRCSLSWRSKWSGPRSSWREPIVNMCQIATRIACWTATTAFFGPPRALLR